MSRLMILTIVTVRTSEPWQTVTNYVTSAVGFTGISVVTWTWLTHARYASRTIEHIFVVKIIAKLMQINKF